MTSFDELMKEKQEEIYDLKISNKKLKEENRLLKLCLDELMLKTDIVNVKIEWWKYCYVRSDKKFWLREDKSDF